MCEAPSESFTNDRPIQHESDVISVGALKMKKAGCYLGTQFLTTGERRWAWIFPSLGAGDEERMVNCDHRAIPVGRIISVGKGAGPAPALEVAAAMYPM